MRNDDAIYFKLYCPIDKAIIVCMQWFDEWDYTQSKFLIDPATGKHLKFDTEEEIERFCKKHMHPRFMDCSDIDIKRIYGK